MRNLAINLSGLILLSSVSNANEAVWSVGDNCIQLNHSAIKLATFTSDLCKAKMKTSPLVGHYVTGVYTLMATHLLKNKILIITSKVQVAKITYTFNVRARRCIVHYRSFDNI